MHHLKPVRPDRVAAYIRWSTEDQGEGTTLEVQREACRHFLLSQGWEYRDDLAFIDDGYSGGNLDRPGLNRLRQLVKTGKVDCVVVYKLDRLSRSVVDTVKLVLDEWEGRCYVKSAKEMVDTTNPMGKQIFYLLVSYAEWERSMIKERTFSGKVQRAREGKNPGMVAPYGYRLGTGGTFAVVPEQAETVRLLFNAYLKQQSIYELTRALNDRGVPAPRGKGWTRSTVNRILRNPMYTGRLTYGKYANNPRYKQDPEEPGRLEREQPLVAQEGVLPQVVAPDLFEDVQRLLTGRRPSYTPGRALSSEALLTGLGTCAGCGHAMVSFQRKHRPSRYYQCAGQQQKGESFCACGFVPQKDANEHVEAKLLSLYGDPAILESVRLELDAVVQAEVRQMEAAVREARKSLEDLAAKLRKIDADYLAGDLSARRYEELKSQLERQAREGQAHAEALTRTLEAGQTRSAEHDALLQDIDRVRKWKELSRAEQKALLRNLVASLRLFRDRKTGQVAIEIEWRVRSHKEVQAAGARA